jgi:hypothetical protein
MTDLFLGFCFCVAFAAGSWGITNNLWKADTVERGLAMYCPDNGQWAWNGECGK